LYKIDVFLEATLEEMIVLITYGKGFTTVNNEDLPPGGSEYNNALYLTI